MRDAGRTNPPFDNNDYEDYIIVLLLYSSQYKQHVDETT